MSKYTTGELAKLCGVTVRTVQYYDSRKIVVPSQLSEGGRRLYSEEDQHRMKIICFLRELGLPINSIGDFLSDEDPGKVTTLLLEQQKTSLQEEIDLRQSQLDKLEDLKRELKSVDNFSVESIGDIAKILSNKKKLRKIHLPLLRNQTLVRGNLRGRYGLMSKAQNWKPQFCAFFIYFSL